MDEKDTPESIDPARQKMPESLEGHFLISETDLMDPNFFRTVVLITDHNEKGAFGLVVNRKSTSSLMDVLPGFSETDAGTIPIFVGGPVQQEYLFVLHSGLPEGTQNEHAETPTPGVIFEPATEPLIDYLQSNWPSILPDDRPRLHFYAGYSGWAPGQLEDEISYGAWYVHKATADIVFHADPEQGWRDALSRKGEIYRIIAETGYRPSLN
jgi:putative transcriptional regulator